MEFNHVPIMVGEVLDGLNLRKGAHVVDATVGGGGHSAAILEKIGSGGQLTIIDRDIDALNVASKRLGAGVRKVHSSFDKIADVVDGKVDAIMADLGVSSYQIDCAERGFSYTADGALDMRMNQSDEVTAAELANELPQQELENIIFNYGEERWAKIIARNIVASRPVTTTGQLTDICKGSVPAKFWKLRGHPAKRTFQALRIAVNNELGMLEGFIRDSVELLNSGGRLAIITFHSLEDRIVKQTFNHLAAECLCPPKIPKCICGHVRKVKLITKRPVIPSAAEIERNPRSASAKLRVAERV